MLIDLISMVEKYVEVNKLYKYLIFFLLLTSGCSSNLNNTSYISGGQINPVLFTSYLYETLNKNIASEDITVDRNNDSVLITIQDSKVFINDSDEIRNDFYKTLDKISELAISSDLSEIKIISHTDDSGSYFEDIAKTSAKAMAVKDYFVKKGFRDNKVVFFGVASKQPLFENNSDENRRKNKRLEIEIETILNK